MADAKAAGSNDYEKVRRGGLILGGVEIKRSEKHKKKKSKKHKRDREEEEPGSEDHVESSAPAAAPIVICSGSGRITTSSTTVQGHEGTKFVQELRVGDAIIITHPTTHGDETRIVKMVLSNVAIGISSAFSSDLISTTPFRYVKAPEDIVAREGAERAKKAKATVEEDTEGIIGKKGGDVISYRVMRANKTGYNIITEEVAGRNRGELLNMRSKKKADRFCM